MLTEVVNGLVASRRRAEGCLTSALGRKVTRKKEDSAGVFLFICGGEREGVVLIPHISDHTPASGRTGGTAVWRLEPCPRSLTGGPRLVSVKPARVRFSTRAALFIAQPVKN
jgi:hypothetical protein